MKGKKDPFIRGRGFGPIGLFCKVHLSLWVGRYIPPLFKVFIEKWWRYPLEILLWEQNLEITHSIRSIRFCLYGFFPLKEGRLQIPSIQTEPRIAPFSFDKGVLFFPKKEITVKELPPVGRNSRWTGAVGDFKVRAEIQEQNITAQEPFFYKIIFEGKGGHPLFIRLPPISFPPSLKSHPPVDKSSFDPSSGQGKKEFEIPLIPKTAGSLTIPSFSFQFFDPTKEKYINLRTKKFFLFVQRRPAEKTDGGGQAKDPTLIDPRKEAQGDLKTEEKEISEAKKAKGFSKSAYWPTFLSHINLSLFWPMFFVFCFFVHSVYDGSKVF